MTALLCLVLAATSPADLVKNVQATYRTGGDMTAAFTQTYSDNLRGKKRVESGKLWVKRDGRVRWSYLEPEAKDFVFDGKTAYFYEPQNAQVTVFERFADSPLAHAMQFLWGQGELSRTFDIRPCGTDCPAVEADETAVLLVPKAPLGSVDHAVMVIDPKSLRVRRSVVFDALGNASHYAFSELRFGATIDEAKLAFTVPPGVSLLRTTADGASAPSSEAPAPRPDPNTKR
jgi:outer membrane lipoprotein carrier protein